MSGEMISGRSLSRWAVVSHGIKLLLATLLCVVACAPAVAAPAPATTPLRTSQEGAPSAATTEVALILAEVAQGLGWPGAISSAADIPGQAVQIRDDHLGMRAALSVMDSLDQPTLLERLAEMGLPRGLYQGREAIIAHPGDGMSADGHIATTGVIVWRCGPYVFAAEDATGAGRETEIAAALYQAVSRANLCGLPATVVILVGTANAPGINSLPYYENLARATAWYHQQNGYSRVELAFTFMDADGDQGTRDWFSLGLTTAHYPSRRALATAALAQAFAGTALPPVAYLERAIIVYAAGSAQIDAPEGLISSAIWLPQDFHIQVNGTQVYVPNLVLLSEDEPLGTWAHELAHTLRTQDGDSNPFRRIPDRYESSRDGGQVGQVGAWDLMSHGMLGGILGGTSPTHMCSYTKEAAGWLRYVSVPRDSEVVLTALENQRMGDAVLMLDDPQSDNPDDFYIIEARDRDAFFGAPASGVMLYHVTYDHQANHAVVNALRPQGDKAGDGEGTPSGRPTLHSVAQADGVTEYIADGFRIVLLAESVAPYRATVRLDSTSTHTVAR